MKFFKYRQTHDYIRNLNSKAKTILWNKYDEKKCNEEQLLESVMIGFPLPPFYFLENNEGKLTTLLNGNILYSLSQFILGTKDLKSKTGEYQKFNDLPNLIQNRIEDARICLNIIDFDETISDEQLKFLQNFYNHK